MKAKNNTDVLLVGEVARKLRVSPGFTYRLIREGKLPALVLGGAKRVPRVALERMLAGEMKRQ
jgi:excisionase family DNA binding protein